MKTLFIDTHNELITIILFQDGKIIEIKKQESSMQHSVYTMPMIEEILSNNNIDPKALDEIVVVSGPGSFTGVRIGITDAKTMAYLLNIPIKVTNVLEMKAMMLEKEEKTVFEPEKNGYYLATYNEKNELVSDYQYLKKEEFEQYCKEHEVEEVNELDYEKIMEYLKIKESTNVHAVVPLYIKKIEVKNDKKSNVE